MRRRSFNPLFWTLAQVGSRIRAKAPAMSDVNSTGLPDVRSMQVPTRHGPVRVMVQRPADPSELTPVVMHMHGGGFVNRHPEQDLHIARYLAGGLGATVLLPDYDTAPRVRYPVAEEEMLDVAQWVQQSAGSQGWDSNVFLLSGVSAGAKLAINVCQQLHTLRQPGPRAAALIVPVTDVSRTDRTSRKRRPAISPLVQRFVGWSYFPDAERRQEPLASPRYDASLGDGMPPTLVLTAEFDTLAAEGADLVRTLNASGVETSYRQFPGVDHGFIAGESGEAMDEALQETVSFFRVRLTEPR